MRIFIILALFSLAAVAESPPPWKARHERKLVSVDGLYEACGVVGETRFGDIPFFDCESYVYGVLDTYVALKPNLPKSKQACFPRDIPPWRVLEELQTTLLNIKDSNHIAAGPAIVEALIKKYPCPKK